jgi:glyoxylase-like metal-dependent hydrolase (beta-lactamase superfamily II)
MMRWAVVSVMLCIPPSAAAQIGNVQQSYARARALVDSAAAAYGGQPALDAVRQIRVQMTGVDHWRNQSRAVSPPYDREEATTDLMIDLAAGRLINTSSMTYPGEIHRAWRWITDRDSSFTVDLRALTFQTNNFPPAQTQTGNLFRLPQWIVIKARESGTALRYLGRMKLSSGAEVEAVSTNVQNQHLTIGFDPQTRLVRGWMWVGMDALLGQVPREVEFVDYRRLNGVLLPARQIDWVGNEIRREFSFDAVTANYHVPDSLVRPPSQTTLVREPEVPPVRSLAPGVWLVGGSTSALAVEFSDHVMVVDAPFNAREIKARLDSLASGKPIRFVVPTHHHDDHAVGVRDFAGAGAAIVSTSTNRAYFERIVPAAKLEIVNGSRVFTDGVRTVEIHQIGPGPHANEMFVAWLPNEGIIFQGDLIDTRANGSIFRGGNNPTTQHFASWLKRKGWNVRTFAGTHGTLAAPAKFDELIRQPILPQVNP